MKFFAHSFLPTALNSNKLLQTITKDAAGVRLVPGGMRALLGVSEGGSRAREAPNVAMFLNREQKHVGNNAHFLEHILNLVIRVGKDLTGTAANEEEVESAIHELVNAIKLGFTAPWC